MLLAVFQAAGIKKAVFDAVKNYATHTQRKNAAVFLYKSTKDWKEKCTFLYLVSPADITLNKNK